MKKRFRAYCPYSKQDFEILWRDAIISFDTNVLLNFYRYSDDTSKLLQGIIRQLGGRVWLAHEVGKEFFTNRLKVIRKQEEAYDDIDNILTDSLNKVESNLRQYKKHRSILVDKYCEDIRKCYNNIHVDLTKLKDTHPSRVEQDTILETILDLFKERIGDAYSRSELDAIRKEGQQRYELKIPPGYKDKDKTSERNVYGDYIIWTQILAKGEVSQLPMIFITDEYKEDWWLIEKGKRLGPRTELIEEYMLKSNNLFYVYSPDSFTEHAKQYLNVGVEDDTIIELQRISKDYRRNRDLDVYDCYYSEYSDDVIDIVMKDTYDNLLSDIKNADSERKDFLNHVSKEQKYFSNVKRMDCSKKSHEQLIETLLSLLDIEERRERKLEHVRRLLGLYKHMSNKQRRLFKTKCKYVMLENSEY